MSEPNYALIESIFRIKLLKVGDVVTERIVNDIINVLGEPLPEPTCLEIHFDSNGQPHTLHDEILSVTMIDEKEG